MLGEKYYTSPPTAIITVTKNRKRKKKSKENKRVWERSRDSGRGREKVLLR
jgi:hypothetical protein